MDPSQSQMTNIVFFLVLIGFSSLFSCSETAFLSVNKIRMRTLAQEGNRKAKVVERLLSDSDRLYSSILVGNNLVNIGASSLTTAVVINAFGDSAQMVAYATGFVTLLILIFGEITPKSLATKHADRIALFISGFISFVVLICTPVVMVLNFVTKFIIRALGGNSENGPSMTEEELKTVVTIGHEEGVLEDQEKQMIHNVFEFSETAIREIMTPRINVISINHDCSFSQLQEVYNEEQFSRYPIHSDSFDEITGILNIKDLLFKEIDKDNFNPKDYAREAFMVYEFNQISDVFAAMRKAHTTMAIVLDEYGVMSGIVTFEDIVEEIVGEIDDEYDDEIEDDIIKINEFEYLIEASQSLNDVNTKLNTNFDSEDFDSIGGLVLGQFSGVPAVEDRIIIDDVTLIINKMHKNRIESLRVILTQKEEVEASI